MYRAWADKGPERPNGPGQTIQLQLTDWFGSASVTAAKTPLNENGTSTASSCRRPRP